MHQVVFRVEPVKSEYALAGANKHQNDRTESADKSRIHLNELLFGTSDIKSDVMTIVKKYPLAHTKSTFCAEMILSANAKYFDEISPDWKTGIYTKAFVDWKENSLDFLKKEFPGLASVNLHMDEEAPHFHAFIVPVHTKDIAYRRGEKTVTRIRYNDVFGDTAQVIADARRTKNSDKTKLGLLQTKYTEAVKTLGLKRGIVYGRAKYKEIHEFQAIVNAPLPTLKRETMQRPGEPTLIEKAQERLGRETDHSIYTKKYEKHFKSVVDHNRDIYSNSEKKARLYEIEKEKAERLKNVLIEKDEQIRVLDDEVIAHKEYVKKLRGISLDLVAEKMLYSGYIDTKKWRNAIDMTKELGGLDYTQSLQWLFKNFGEIDTQRTAVEYVVNQTIEKVRAIAIQDKPEPFLKMEIDMKKSLDMYADAVASDSVRVTSVRMTDAGVRVGGQLLTQEPDGISTFVLSAMDKIIRSSANKRHENGDREHVYFSPISLKTHHILIDDLNADGLDRLKEEGFRPAFVLETSPGNFQAIINVPKQSDDEQVNNAVENYVTHKLNWCSVEHAKQELDKAIKSGDEKLIERVSKMVKRVEKFGGGFGFGDSYLMGRSHPHRVPGAPNNKAKNRQEDGTYRLVNVVSNEHVYCDRCIEIAIAARDEIVKEHEKVAVHDKAVAKENRENRYTDPAQIPTSMMDMRLADFSKDVAFIDSDKSRTLKAIYMAHRENIKDVNQTATNEAIDLMVAQRLRATGHTSIDIHDALAHSTMKDKGYAHRTMLKAFDTQSSQTIDKYEQYKNGWKKIEEAVTKKIAKELERERKIKEFAAKQREFEQKDEPEQK